jgi:hypothetical protein
MHALEDAAPVPYLAMQLIGSLTVQENLDLTAPLLVGVRVGRANRLPAAAPAAAPYAGPHGGAAR